ncbi:MGMT family protein [Pleionea sediminis]|uniref:MGMT family protein n=1 Tax=Pleionea sediminis TaxID=2569479 RepID=UPI00197C9D4F|nr:MGMT family protein [Pleionea sediminis]
MSNLSAKRILTIVKSIPKGSVASYGQVADLAGLPGRARLVGKVLKENSEKDLPWHRVIRASGQLAFDEASTVFKQQRKLLANDGVTVCNRRVDMSLFQWKPSLEEVLHQLPF